MPFCASMGMLGHLNETIDLLDARPLIVTCMEPAPIPMHSSAPSPFNDLIESSKLVLVFGATEAVPVPAVLGSFLFCKLPASYYPAAVQRVFCLPVADN